MTSRLQEVVNVVKIKNPSLLLQLTGAKQGASSASASSSSGAAAGVSSSGSGQASSVHVNTLGARGTMGGALQLPGGPSR